MNSNIKSGDQLYKVYNDSRAGRSGHVTVKTVGTKWLTVVDGSRQERFDPETLRAESGRSRLYVSKDIHDAEVARRDAWARLRHVVERYTPPEGVATETILQAVALLTPKSKEVADA